MQKLVVINLWFVAILVSISLFLSSPLIINLKHSIIHAQSEDELDRQLREKQEEIKKLEDQLAQARAQEKTLTSQLKYIDGQIKLTELKIEETKFQIRKLEKEIDELNSRISRISNSLDTISEVLLNRIVSTYKFGNFSFLDMIFSSRGFADLIERLKYIEVAQANDKRILYQLQATKLTYNDQRQDKEVRQAQQQKLKNDLENYSSQLDNQKKEKEELLRVTKNNEARFQELLARLRADADSIARALSSRGVKLGNVSRGERIASVGNSGCSTGPHLHFEVMTPAHVENDLIVGRENKVDPKSYLDSGKLGKPLSSYTGNDCSGGGSCNPGDITTKFGQVYFLGTHHGLDIADYQGASILAAESGVAYSTQDSRACYLTGTVGKGVFVDHGNNIVTLYWHIP